MSKILRLTAFLSITALALLAAMVAGAADSSTTYTCTKVKQNGDTDVRVDVPESSLGGLINAGFTCVANDDDEQGRPGGDPSGEQGDDETPVHEEGNPNQAGPTPPASAPGESRSLFCMTAAAANAANAGTALDLFDSQGELLVSQGLVTPARFYEGVGASCDVLPGYAYAGYWVDHVGDVVPGVAVYPLYVAG